MKKFTLYDLAIYSFLGSVALFILYLVVYENWYKYIYNENVRVERTLDALDLMILKDIEYLTSNKGAERGLEHIKLVIEGKESLMREYLNDDLSEKTKSMINSSLSYIPEDCLDDEI